MKAVHLSYPHDRTSLAPARLRAEEVWQVAADMRRQACAHPRRPKVELPQLMAATRRLVVNGCQFETEWECGEAVRDGRGLPVFGATEYDPALPDVARLRLHGPALGSAEDLLRSTALHELGHIVFDVPTWMRLPFDDAKPVVLAHFKRRADQPRRPGAGPDWSEWRANEFMGAFLAPKPLLHDLAAKRAACLGLDLKAVRGSLPVVAVRRLCDLDPLVLDLADTFGLSANFIEVRLRRYGIVRQEQRAPIRLSSPLGSELAGTAGAP